MTTITKYAFDKCSNLEAINIQQNNPVYMSLDGILYSKENGIATSLELCPLGKKGIIKIPDSVTTITAFAFGECSGLTGVDIPNSVTEIGNYAFDGCSGLTKVVIPNSVTKIGRLAFYECSSLISVDIPSSVREIDSEAFGNSNPWDIYCHWEKPRITTDDIWDRKTLMNSILYVPIGTKVNYEKIAPWRNFWNIEEIDYNTTTGIKDVVDPDKSTLYEIDRFDVSGKHVSKDYKGLVIIRYSDGSMKKQIVK